MATVLNRTIRTHYPQRDGSFYAEVEFQVQDWNRIIHVRATLLPQGTDVHAWADEIEVRLNERLKEEEWDDAVNEAVELGLNPLRAERVYTFNTRMEIALRLKDKVDSKVQAVEAALSKWQLLQNRINTFLGLP